MKINKLTATFGKFNNESISFHSGLNIIEAPNESGKSTWCAFILAMLYGIDSSERTKTGTLPAKQRYAPWSGAPMEGTAELTADNCDITIIRSTRLKNAPMREFSAVYTGTSIPVEGMNASNAGQLLTGVSRDVFARSAFVGQGAAAVTGSPEMEKRIQSIFSTGEEEISFTEANDRLSAWQRKRSYRQQGFLPDVDVKINDLRESIERADKTAAEIRAAEEQLDECEEKCSELESDVIRARKERRKQMFRDIDAARAEARLLAEEQNAALEELNDRRNDLRESLFGRRSADSVEAEAEKDLSRLEELSTEKKPSILWLPALLCFLLALAGAVVYQQVFTHIAVIIAAAVFCLLALVCLGLYIRQRSELLEAQEEMQAILRKYKADNAEDIVLKLDEHHARCVAAHKAEEKEKKASAAADEAYERLTNLEARASEDTDSASGSTAEADFVRELAGMRKQAVALSSKISTDKGKLAVTGDPVVMRSELARLEQERLQLQEELEAIALAKTALKEADDEIQSRFSPELGRVAAEYMSFVTGGRYEGILLNRDFSAMTKTTDDAVARKSEYLSAGTIDLLYLAVRLAVCELALPEGETCPLIIDDALVNMDDTRYEQAIKLLGEIAKERQVILFTCRR
ncbi:MAG: AAA family ATPase [Oscillospiraceae bacterium]|nr:AAA family ATPase [Oscillospiraceae bacterium]